MANKLLSDKIQDVFSCSNNIIVLQNIKNIDIDNSDFICFTEKEPDFFKSITLSPMNLITAFQNSPLKPIILSEEFFLFIKNFFNFLLINKNICIIRGNDKRDYASFNNLVNNNIIPDGDIDSASIHPEIKVIDLCDNLDYIEVKSAVSLIEQVKNNTVVVLSDSDFLSGLFRDNNVHMIPFSSVRSSNKDDSICLVTDSIKKTEKIKESLQLLKSDGFSFKVIYYNGISISQNVKNIDLDSKLKEYFGFDSFREYLIYNELNNDSLDKISQKDIIQYVMNEVYSNSKKNDLIFVASTGGGKSLIYMMLAKLLHDMGKMTIVVEPLIALMNDQFKKISDCEVLKNISAVLSSENSMTEREAIYEKINKGEISLLFVSPELLSGNSIHQFLNNREIGLCVVDEAHVVDTWGKTFRVDYGYLGDYLKKIGAKNDPVKLILTATAINGGTFDTLSNISEFLRLNDPKLIITNYTRNNISFNINKVEKSDDVLNNIQNTIILNAADNIKNNKKTIIYCPWKNDVERFREKLPQELNSFVGFFTSNTDKDEKKRIMSAFETGSIKVVFATKAFGMGIDIPDIREVIHYRIPVSLIDYIQEIGRAGRDGKPAVATVYYYNGSIDSALKLENSSIPSQFEIKNVYKYIFNKAINSKSRNITVSPDDLIHIFKSDKNNRETKFRTALFIIEKELESLTSKKILNKMFEGYKYLYFTVKEEDIINIQKFSDIVEVIDKEYSNYTLYKCKINSTRKLFRLDVQKFLENNFKDISSRKFTFDFFKDNSKQYFGCDVVPVTLYNINVEDYNTGLDRLTRLLNFFENFIKSSGIFAKFIGKGINEEDFYNSLDSEIKKNYSSLSWLGDEVQDKVVSIFKNMFLNNGKNDNKILAFASSEYKMIKRISSTREINLQIKDLYKEVFYGQKIVSLALKASDADLNPIINIARILNLCDLAEIESAGGETFMAEYYISGSLPLYITPQIPTAIRARIKNEKIMSETFFEMEANDNMRWNYLENYLLGRNF